MHPKTQIQGDIINNSNSSSLYSKHCKPGLLQVCILLNYFNFIRIQERSPAMVLILLTNDQDLKWLCNRPRTTKSSRIFEAQAVWFQSKEGSGKQQKL